MGFRKSADGIEKKGKTDTKVFPNDGPKVILSGPKHGADKMGKSMKSVGRNMARAMNQKSSGRGR